MNDGRCRCGSGTPGEFGRGAILVGGASWQLWQDPCRPPGEGARGPEGIALPKRHMLEAPGGIRLRAKGGEHPAIDAILDHREVERPWFARGGSPHFDLDGVGLEHRIG
jgi:hypothetical protein